MMMFKYNLNCLNSMIFHTKKTRYRLSRSSFPHKQVFWKFCYRFFSLFYTLRRRDYYSRTYKRDGIRIFLYTRNAQRDSLFLSIVQWSRLFFVFYSKQQYAFSRRRHYCVILQYSLVITTDKLYLIKVRPGTKIVCSTTRFV